MGATGNDGGSGSGHVRVFKYSNNAWTQMGSDIDGTGENEFVGNTVDLNDDGTIVAFSAYGKDQFTGAVRVFEYSNNAWTQLGSDIDGEAVSNFFGISVSINGDGTIVAAGAHGHNNQAGHVRIYEYSNNVWTQMGSDINGGTKDNFGFYLSIDNDGNTLAIGAYNDDDGGEDAGQVRIFEYSNDAWTQVGDDIDGEAAGDNFGIGLSISGDGSTVAIGGWKNDGSHTDAGHVQVFRHVPPTLGNACASDADCNEKCINSVCTQVWQPLIAPLLSVIDACVDGRRYHDGINGLWKKEQRMALSATHAWTEHTKPPAPPPVPMAAPLNSFPTGTHHLLQICLNYLD